MGKKLNLIGEQYGLLTVIEEGKGCVTPNGSKKSTWICKCKCGNIVEVTGGNLKYGTSKSCGCVRKEKTIERSTKHNNSKKEKVTKEYTTWIEIKRRCNNTNCQSYPNYGGRDITVCSEWLNSFENFLADVGPAPSPQHSIDRIDNNGNYEPSNVRWVENRSIQSINRRTPKHNTSGHKGVGIEKTTGKWKAYISINNKQISLGLFGTKEEAIEARLAAEEQYHKPIVSS